MFIWLSKKKLVSRVKSLKASQVSDAAQECRKVFFLNSCIFKKKIDNLCFRFFMDFEDRYILKTILDFFFLRESFNEILSSASVCQTDTLNSDSNVLFRFYTLISSTLHRWGLIWIIYFVILHLLLMLGVRSSQGK